MARKLMGPTAYYVRRKATHCKSGETSLTSFGPFRTYKEAQAKQREDEEALGKPEYEYDYHIEPVSTALLSNLR
jgi:hypothetical protein